MLFFSFFFVAIRTRLYGHGRTATWLVGNFFFLSFFFKRDFLFFFLGSEMRMHDNFPSMHFFFLENGIWKYDSAHLEIFSQVLGFGARSNVEPFLGLAGIF